MTDQMQEPTNSTGAGFDRRTMLAKAAAAGVVAWSVPLLMSEPAFAGNGVCTAKCAPAAFTPTLKGVDVCNSDFNSTSIGGYDASLANFIGTANKMGIISFQSPGSVTCPCGGVAASPVISGLGPGSIFDKINSSANTQAELQVQCLDTSGSFEIIVKSLAAYNISNVVPAGQGYTSGNSFAIVKSSNGTSGVGAIGNSTNKLRTPVCVAIGCPDKVGGDIVYRRCLFNLCFSYKPEGACGQAAVVLSLFTLVPNSCKVGCGTPC